MTIDEMLAVARSRLSRLSIDDFPEAVAAGALVVDIRTHEEREHDGELPGAVWIERNKLLWRLAPSSESKIFDLEPDRRIIIVCDEGYSSSLAAVELHKLGLDGATDLVGGFQAWRRSIADRSGGDR